MNHQVIALYVAAIVAKTSYKQLVSQLTTTEFDYRRVCLVLLTLAHFGNRPEKKSELELFLSKCTGENVWKRHVHEEYRRLGYPDVSIDDLL